MDWRIYYSDESTFSSKDGRWTKAPDDDVQVVVVFNPDGTRVLYSGGDWYWNYNGEIGYVSSSEHWGTWQPKPTDLCACVSCIKRGTRTNIAAYNAIYERASNDRTF